MKDKDKKDKCWWKNFHDASDALGGLCFFHLAHVGSGDPFPDTREELNALKFNLKRFADTLTKEQQEAFERKITRLERVIDGTQAAYQDAEVIRTRKLAHDVIESLKARGLWDERAFDEPASPALETLLEPGETMPLPGPLCVEFFRKKGIDISKLNAKGA
jgi:hypothetical protein